MRVSVIFFALISLVIPAVCQVKAPVEVVDGGVAAVDELGKQCSAGKFVFIYERMNPLWRKRLATKLGGEEILKAQCESIGAQLAKSAASLISHATEGFPTIYEVSPGKKTEVIDGKEVESLIYTKWLMVVPTVARYRIIGKDGKHIIESHGFQIAVTDKTKLDWTFIDGSTTTVADLRNLFISLPMTMKLPELTSKRVEP
jgi:hypothetical protein